jgi:two-component system, OmpR family, phosphate regulon response regulator PhoB
VSQPLKLKVLLALQDETPYIPLEAALGESGLHASLATNSNDALRLTTLEKPDFVVIDRMLPDSGGIRLCRNIRANPELAETRIIMLGESDDLNERILSMEAGSDDYIVKPFAIEELLVRITALQRRHPLGKAEQTLTAGSIKMIPTEWAVYVDGIPVHLTETEYRLLHELLQVKGRVLTRESLLERVWGYQKVHNLETRTLDVHMSRLRTKLGSAGSNIITVRNVGYRIDTATE